MTGALDIAGATVNFAGANLAAAASVFAALFARGSPNTSEPVVFSKTSKPRPRSGQPAASLKAAVL